jgi:hypothetical protein
MTRMNPMVRPKNSERVPQDLPVAMLAHSVEAEPVAAAGR